MRREKSESAGPDRDLRTGEAALGWARTGGGAARVAELARRQRRSRQRFRLTATASVAALALASAAWLFRPPPAAHVPLSSPHPALVLAAPERRTLPDGSVVELKPGASLSVEFGPAVRRVLLEAGEAHFAVAKNKDIPFVVRAGTIEVRAVGTEFAVERAAGSVDILVTEGRVAVERPSAAAAPAPLALLEAGQATMVALTDVEAVRTTAVPAEEQRVRLAWRVPRIELSSTPLAEVVDCFNRHGPVRLALEDPALGRLQLSGVLRPDSPNALLHVLRTDFGLSDERQADGTILIRKR